MSSRRCKFSSVASALSAPCAVGNFQTVMVAMDFSSGVRSRTGWSGSGVEDLAPLELELRVVEDPGAPEPASSRSWAGLVFVSVRGGDAGAGSTYLGSDAQEGCWLAHRASWPRETRVVTAVARRAAPGGRAPPPPQPGPPAP